MITLGPSNRSRGGRPRRNAPVITTTHAFASCPSECGAEVARVWSRDPTPPSHRLGHRVLECVGCGATWLGAEWIYASGAGDCYRGRRARDARADRRRARKALNGLVGEEEGKHPPPDKWVHPVTGQELRRRVPIDKIVRVDNVGFSPRDEWAYVPPVGYKLVNIVSHQGQLFAHLRRKGI